MAVATCSKAGGAIEGIEFAETGSAIDKKIPEGDCVFRNSKISLELCSLLTEPNGDVTATAIAP